MNFLLNNMQLLVILLVVGGTVLQWVFKTIAEQKAVRRARLEAEQRELEVLRTGRDPASPPMGVPAEFRQQPDGLSREAELAELRRRAKARAQRSSAPDRVDPGMPMPDPSQPPTQPHPLEVLLGLPPGSTTGGTIPPRTGRSRDIAAERRKRQQQGRANTPARVNAPTRVNAPSSAGDSIGSTINTSANQDRFSEATRAARLKAREEQRRKNESVQREQDRRATRQSEAAQNQRVAAAHAAAELASPSSPAKRRITSIGLAGIPNTRETWRRALIVNEILNKPLAMRSVTDRDIF